MLRAIAFSALLAFPVIGGAQTVGELLKPERVRAVIRIETEQFVANFGVATGMPTKVEPDYYQAVETPVLAIRVLNADPRITEQLLLARYGKFLGGLSAFSVAKNKDKALLLNKAVLDAYMAAARKTPRCGEYPCVQGCGKGGCTDTCGPC